ncbi:MAG: thioredoxin family protein [Candidatus Mcinerneyibacterium aminivorans]|uniref:Thioredoxin family protein n=1 Tax=Candidatus Mcinerneyibacterium aminivorans TaxID=2703815 RepID=A0A5D0MI01_9BACT|nr:MAG: thioredoxin family protein [Candidatus Mcinerneyibacterium aminivorans]
MKKIEVLGTGCPKCKKTVEIIEKVVDANNFEAEIIKVEDVKKITEKGVFMTPAVAVDGKVKIRGKVPSEEEVAGWFE